MKTENEIPRRMRLDKMTPPEVAITHAMDIIEKFPETDKRLTEAQNLLSQARNLVADFVEEKTPYHFTISEIKELEKRVALEEITYSRMVEIMNEKVIKGGLSIAEKIEGAKLIIANANKSNSHE